MVASAEFQGCTATGEVVHGPQDARKGRFREEI